jgi:Icc-related predicted phosphoesterase
MKIATVSDVHGMWDQLDYPGADVLVFAGDIMGNYNRDPVIDAHLQLEELERFDLFTADLVAQGLYSHIVFVAGNHDWLFEKLPREARSKLGSHITYLENSGATLLGYNFYGAPQQNWFHSWAFNFPPPGTSHAKKAALLCWDAIPNDVDILITHGPPYGILDLTYGGQNVGCPYLEDRLQHLHQLKLHIFGHIHYSYGKKMRQKTLFVNTAICDENYDPTNPIPVINV